MCDRIKTVEPPKPYWSNPWGYEDEEPPPERSTFFPEVDDDVCWYSARLSIEDFWQHNAVFYNLIKGNTCHSDSYMTGVAYANLDRAADIFKRHYSPTKEEMTRHFNSWINIQTFVPALQIAASEFCRKFDVDVAELQRKRKSDEQEM